jgi:hypothetical protein
MLISIYALTLQQWYLLLCAIPMSTLLTMDTYNTQLLLLALRIL